MFLADGEEEGEGEGEGEGERGMGSKTTIQLLTSARRE